MDDNLREATVTTDTALETGSEWDTTEIGRVKQELSDHIDLYHELELDLRHALEERDAISRAWDDEHARTNAAEAERDALAAEVERLRDAEEIANHDAARLVYELARLGIAYEGDDPLARLVEEITALREQLDAAGEAQTTSRLSAAGKVDDGL